ncbi:hypothetical protein KIPE111705_43795 [Kibdelosporangium persicum]
MACAYSHRMNGIEVVRPISSTSACEAYIRLYTSTYSQAASPS